jgi:hypothetical protein
MVHKSAGIFKKTMSHSRQDQQKVTLFFDSSFLSKTEPVAAAVVAAVVGYLLAWALLQGERNERNISK